MAGTVQSCLVLPSLDILSKGKLYGYRTSRSVSLLRISVVFFGASGRKWVVFWRYATVVTVAYTGCFKKSFTTLKAYRNLYIGHTQRFELSKCSKTHRVDIRGLRTKLSLSCSTVASETHGRTGDLAWRTEQPV